MRDVFFGALGAACIASIVAAQVQNTGTLNPRDLRPLASFSGIGDQAERSRALFNEIAKVITHPRCMNCHPAADAASTPSTPKAAIRMSRSSSLQCLSVSQRRKGDQGPCMRGSDFSFARPAGRLIWTACPSSLILQSPAPSAASPRSSAFGRSAPGAAKTSISIAGSRALTRSRRRNRLRIQRRNAM